MSRPKRVLEKDVHKKLEESVEYRYKIFEKLLSHISEGYSIDCFSDMSVGAVHAAIGRYPQEFDKESLARAERDGKAGWERIGREQATGRCLGNSRSWYYNMAHRYGWSDRVDARVEHAGSVAVEVVSYARPKPDVKPLDSDVNTP